MPDIEHCVAFSESIVKIIELKTQVEFTHRNWGDEDLEEVRSEIRDFYRTVQKGSCSYCKQPLSLVSALNCHVEHIVPKSLHSEFTFTPKNLCVICADCNQIKREQETLGEIPETLERPERRKMYPRSSSAFKIIHPHFDVYEDHIWIARGYYIDKGSKKGSFTIGACKLNRKLAEFGWVPEVSSDEEVARLMTEYLAEKSTNKRAAILDSLREVLLW